MRRAVVAVRERRALTRLALPCRRAAARHAAVECACLDLLLDEAHRGLDALRDRPGDLRLHRDREVAADVLEERAVRLGEIVRIRGQAFHRPLARVEHVAAVLELRVAVYVRVDQVLDRAIDRSRVLIHAVLNVQDPLVHTLRVSPPTVAASPLRTGKSFITGAARRRLYTLPLAVTNVFTSVNSRFVPRGLRYPPQRKLNPPRPRQGET